MAEITCVRCGRTTAGFEKPPFPGEVGKRVVAEICPDCWQQWTRQQMMLINHYGLNLMDPQARTFLTRQMEAFLFARGQEEQVDTSKEGTIEW
jgi:Fe-S cluster biosynthesis and repair protein YggX